MRRRQLHGRGRRALRRLRRFSPGLGLHNERWREHGRTRHPHRHRHRRGHLLWCRRLQLGRGLLLGRRRVRRSHRHDDLRRRRGRQLYYRDHLQVCRSGPGRHPLRHPEAQDLLRPPRLPLGPAPHGCRHLPRRPIPDDDAQSGDYNDNDRAGGADRHPAPADDARGHDDACAHDDDGGPAEDLPFLGRPAFGHFRRRAPELLRGRRVLDCQKSPGLHSGPLQGHEVHLWPGRYAEDRHRRRLHRGPRHRGRAHGGRRQDPRGWRGGLLPPRQQQEDPDQGWPGLRCHDHSRRHRRARGQGGEPVREAHGAHLPA
mmetsp:Transcript_122439/g.391481  ORF Transcript_122439/g.391481 Transcript_122439/m.391481 type:complete len:315 (-) Transcript_122439:364-1308(-)